MLALICTELFEWPYVLILGNTITVGHWSLYEAGFYPFPFNHQNPAERHVFLLCSEVLNSSKRLSMAGTAWVIESVLEGVGEEVSPLCAFCPMLLPSSHSVFDLQADQWHSVTACGGKGSWWLRGDSCLFSSMLQRLPADTSDKGADPSVRGGLSSLGLCRCALHIPLCAQVQMSSRSPLCRESRFLTPRLVCPHKDRVLCGQLSFPGHLQRYGIWAHFSSGFRKRSPYRSAPPRTCLALLSVQQPSAACEGLCVRFS